MAVFRAKLPTAGLPNFHKDIFLLFRLHDKTMEMLFYIPELQLYGHNLKY